MIESLALVLRMRGVPGSILDTEVIRRFLSLLGRWWDNALDSHDYFLPHPFQFIIHSHSSSIRRYITYIVEKA
jgi:hypothetical protein